MRIDELEATILAIRNGGWGDRRLELGLYARVTAMLLLVAEDEGTIAGTTIASASSGIGWIGLVFVAASMRGRGLGSTLTRAGLTHLQASGCRSILLAAMRWGERCMSASGS